MFAQSYNRVHKDELKVLRFVSYENSLASKTAKVPTIRYKKIANTLSNSVNSA